jgi:DNA (cytosine-5)-methyltransferase 1
MSRWKQQLILSLFPGADLFGLGFEKEGFSVVKGPDPILGGDIRKYSVGQGLFHGIIGGPPCQLFSQALLLRKGHTQAINLIPEFERIVKEARPRYWVMENVPQAPEPRLANCRSFILNAWEVGSTQTRKRRFSSNLPLDRAIELLKLPERERFQDPWPTVTATEHKVAKGNSGGDHVRAGRRAGRRLTLEEINVLMGLPQNFSTPCLTVPYAHSVRGNGVPIQMARAIAKAVKIVLSAIERKNS